MHSEARLILGGLTTLAFATAVLVVLPYLKARSIGGGLMALSHVVFAAHFVRLLIGGRQVAQPNSTYLAAPGAL